MRPVSPVAAPARKARASPKIDVGIPVARPLPGNVGIPVQELVGPKPTLLALDCQGNQLTCLGVPQTPRGPGGRNIALWRFCAQAEVSDEFPGQLDREDPSTVHSRVVSVTLLPGEADAASNSLCQPKIANISICARCFFNRPCRCPIGTAEEPAERPLLNLPLILSISLMAAHDGSAFGVFQEIKVLGSVAFVGRELCFFAVCFGRERCIFAFRFGRDFVSLLIVLLAWLLVWCGCLLVVGTCVFTVLLCYMLFSLCFFGCCFAIFGFLLCVFAIFCVCFALLSLAFTLSSLVVALRRCYLLFLR